MAFSQAVICARTSIHSSTARPAAWSRHYAESPPPRSDRFNALLNAVGDELLHLAVGRVWWAARCARSNRAERFLIYP